MLLCKKQKNKSTTPPDLLSEQVEVLTASVHAEFRVVSALQTTRQHVRPSGLLVPCELVQSEAAASRRKERAPPADQQLEQAYEQESRCKKKSNRNSPPDMRDKCFVQELEGMLCFLGKNLNL